jgi:hypothetical protein
MDEIVHASTHAKKRNIVRRLLGGMLRAIGNELDWAWRNNKMLYIYLSVAVASLVVCPIIWIMEQLKPPAEVPPNAMPCSVWHFCIFVALGICYIMFKNKDLEAKRVRALEEENRQLREEAWKRKE